MGGSRKKTDAAGDEISPLRLRNIAVQTLRYSQTEAGRLPAWRVLAEYGELSRQLSERTRETDDRDAEEGWEGVE